MTIGIVIANKDYGQYISDAINSIVNQSRDDWRLVIVDYGSTDHSDSIYQMWTPESRIMVIRQRTKAQLVPLEAKNIGIRELRADPTVTHFLCFDADDMMLPSFLTELVGTAVEARAAVCWSTFQYMDNRTIAYGKRFELDGWFDKIPDECLVPEYAVYSREALDRADAWYYNCEELSIMAAFDRFLRVLQVYGPDRCRYVPRVLMLYRQHKGQLSQTSHVQQFGKERRMVKDRYWERVDTVVAE